MFSGFLGEEEDEEERVCEGEKSLMEGICSDLKVTVEVKSEAAMGEEVWSSLPGEDGKQENRLCKLV